MKKTILFFLLIATPCFSQKVINWSTNAFFARKVTAQDSAIGTLGSGEKAWRSSIAQDTLTTNWIRMQNLNADMTFEFEKINVSGTDTAQVNILLLRGGGSPDSSGFSRHQLVITNTDTTMQFHLSDSTFISKRLFTMYAFEIRERAAQGNDYILNVNQFSPNGKASSGNIWRRSVKR